MDIALAGGDMAALESLFGAIGTWFGFAGSCVAGADPTCRPFLAFVALTAASTVALTLVVLAFRSIRSEFAAHAAEARSAYQTAEVVELQPRIAERARRLPELQAAPGSVAVGGLSATA